MDTNRRQEQNTEAETHSDTEGSVSHGTPPFFTPEIVQIGQNEGSPLDWMEEAEAKSRVLEYIDDRAHGAEREEQERTKAAKRIFLEIFQKTMGTITVACEKADIARDTYYRWMKTDPQFRSAVAQVEAQRVDMVEDRLFKLIQSDDGPSVRFFLERKAADYKAKSQTEIVTGDKTFEDLMYEMAEKKKAAADALKKNDGK